MGTVQLCPQVCTVVQKDLKAKVSIEFGCGGIKERRFCRRCLGGRQIAAQHGGIEHITQRHGAAGGGEERDVRRVGGVHGVAEGGNFDG